MRMLCRQGAAMARDELFVIDNLVTLQPLEVSVPAVAPSKWITRAEG